MEWHWLVDNDKDNVVDDNEDKYNPITIPVFIHDNEENYNPDSTDVDLKESPFDSSVSPVENHLLSLHDAILAGEK